MKLVYDQTRHLAELKQWLTAGQTEKLLEGLEAFLAQDEGPEAALLTLEKALAHRSGYTADQMMSLSGGFCFQTMVRWIGEQRAEQRALMLGFAAETGKRQAPGIAELVAERMNRQHSALIYKQAAKETEGEQKDFLTQTEASKFLSISRPSLNKFEKEGAIQAYRVGVRNLRYKRSELEAYLLSNPKKLA